MRRRLVLRRWVQMTSWSRYSPILGLWRYRCRWSTFGHIGGGMSKSLTDPAVSAMRSPQTSQEALRCALVIAWLSGDAELIPEVRAVLDRVDPKSRNALHACIALEALGDETAEFARMAEQLAFTRENGWRGLQGLMGLGGQGVEGLRRWLKQRGHTERVRASRGRYPSPLCTCGRSKGRDRGCCRTVPEPCTVASAVRDRGRIPWPGCSRERSWRRLFQRVRP